MEHLVSAAYCLIELIGHKIDVECGVVREYIYKYTYVIFLRRIKHRLHLFLGTENVVSDGPVGRLVIMVPVSFLLIEYLDVAALRAEACVHRRCLKHCEARIRNLLHVLGDCREIPTPDMKDCLCVRTVRIVCHPVYRLVLSLRCAGKNAQAREDCKCSFHWSDSLLYRCTFSNSSLILQIY